MSSGITLSAATRQNLLSLQGTADLLSTTQNRLSTGKKVNSALDSPVNFFTSQALTDRSSALSGLLDGISNGIQTIQAANTGLTKLQSLASQLTSTAQQALSSSNAFTAKATLSTTAQTGVTADNLLGGGATVAAGTALVAASKSPGSTLTTSATTGTSNAAGVLGLADGAQFSITTGGNTSVVTLSATDTISDYAAKVSAATGGAVTAAFNDTNRQFTLVGSTNATSFSVGNVGSATTLTNIGITAATYAATTGPAAAGTTTGSAVGIAGGATAASTDTAAKLGFGANSQFTINGKVVQFAGTDTLDQIAKKIGAATGGDPTTGAGGDVTASFASGKLTLQAKDGVTAVTVGGTSAVTTGLGINAASVGAGVGAITGGSTAADVGFAAGDTFSVNGAIVTIGGSDSLTALATKINTATGGKVTASFTDGKFTLTATDNTTPVNLTDGTGGGKVSKLGFVSGNTVAAGSGAGALSGQTLNITVNNPLSPNQLPTSTTISFGKGSGQVSTLAQLNAQLSASNAQASVDATGKLSISTMNEAGADNLTISGTATGAGKAFGTTLTATPTIGGDGSSSRNNLVTTYNNLLTQIDQLSLDSGFNGVNLLSGDNLKISFNEKNDSSLSVQGTKVSSQNLGLMAIGNVDFQDSNSINAVLSKVSSATSTLKSQAAALGSNLAVVQNRQDFTKQMINVLDTGSANLTNADLNEEAANSQALSTRNSLGISALSLANQAQQGILQLLR